MKLKIGDKVYLQKYDVMSILHELNFFPGEILNETFSDDDGFFYVINPADGFRFDCVYKNPKSVEWLMEQDWIIDFDEFSKKPLGELKNLRKCLIAEHRDGVNGFNAKDEAYRKSHFDEEKEKLNKLSCKIDSIETLIRYLKGKIQFVFPDGYHDSSNH